MSDSEHDVSVLGKRSRHGEDPENGKAEAEGHDPMDEDDEDDDVGPMPMPSGSEAM